MIRRMVIAGLLLVVIAVAALGWLAGREDSVSWVLERVATHSQGRLSVEGVRGSFYGPLHIDLLRWETPERRIEAHSIDLAWSLGRRLQLDRASVQLLRIEKLQSSDEPLELPASLRLPFDVAAPQVSVARIEILQADSRYEFHDLSAALDYSGQDDRFRLSRLNVRLPWGVARAELVLDAARPYRLTGKIALESLPGKTTYTARADLAGSLEQIKLSAIAAAPPMSAEINALLQPFDKSPLQRLILQVHRFNPAQFDETWPTADIGLALSLRSAGADRLEGTLSLQNRLAGPIDRGRLPLKMLTARLDGAPDDFRLNELHLDLGSAGQLDGTAQINEADIGLDLHTRNLNLRGLQGKLKPTRLAGNLRIDSAGGVRRFVARLAQPHYLIQLDASHGGDGITISRANIRAYDSELHMTGNMAMDAARSVRLSGSIKRFNPADFGAFPVASINARFAASGQLEPQWQTTLEFTVAASRFRGQPLSAQGLIHAAPGRVWDSRIEARLADNTLLAEGDFGRRNDRLDWRIDARNLAAIGPESGGSMKADGTLSGTWDQPSGTFRLSGQALRWDETRIGRLDASGRLDGGLDGSLTLETGFSNIRSGGLELAQASFSGQGKRSDHVLKLAARGLTLDMQAELAGGWFERTGWRGELRKFSNRGRHPVALLAPARLTLGPQQWSLGKAIFDVAEGRVTIHELTRKGAQLASSGELRDVSLAQLPELLGRQLEIETSLRIGGSWSIRTDSQVNGTLTLMRESGDATVLTEPKIPLGLSRLTLKLEARNSRLSGVLDMAGSRLGTISAQGSTQLTRQQATWGVAGNAPISLAADIDIPSIAWLSPIVDPSYSTQFDGLVHGRVRAEGTLNAPSLQGDIRASSLQLEWPGQGIHLKDGSLTATLKQDTMHLTQFVMHGGAGRLTGQGSLKIVQGTPRLQFQLAADKLEAIAMPERLLILSGTAEARTEGGRFLLNAKLKADRGLIELPSTTKPTLSDDVVVLGRTQAIEKEPSLRPEFDLTFDLGDNFFFKGHGLDAQLGGMIRVRAADSGRPRANGTIHVIRGAYAAYGQTLTIGRGILNFVGPIDNPGLNIVALRKNLPVEAGVAVTGTALHPRVSLVSTPAVSDSEKLSWLVLGHGIEHTSGTEFNALQAAAAALLSTGESASFQSRIAQAVGLEEFTITGTSGLESTMLSLGKRLSSKVYVTYEQGLLGAAGLVKINYILSKHFLIRAQTGSDNAVDLFYTFSFD